MDLGLGRRISWEMMEMVRRYYAMSGPACTDSTIYVTPLEFLR